MDQDEHSEQWRQVAHGVAKEVRAWWAARPLSGASPSMRHRTPGQAPAPRLVQTVVLLGMAAL